MNKKLFSLAMPLSLLALSLVVVSCDNGTSPGGANVFTITGITNQMETDSKKVCIVGMYPTGTTAEQALSDTKRIYKEELGPLKHIVAGREVDHDAATGPEGDWTETGTLKSASSNFTADWRGSGTFTAYWLLQDLQGNYKAYKLKDARTISEGEHTIVHAVNDFESVSITP
ncbi:MAG: hypothetical protein LBE02_06745 [Spirochaetaceae bacterium]|nr:hypothetical protein [Spirochaetaceae bacterium]